jgi:hypothetical protein
MLNISKLRRISLREKEQPKRKGTVFLREAEDSDTRTVPDMVEEAVIRHTIRLGRLRLKVRLQGFSEERFVATIVRKLGITLANAANRHYLPLLSEWMIVF